MLRPPVRASVAVLSSLVGACTAAPVRESPRLPPPETLVVWGYLLDAESGEPLPGDLHVGTVRTTSGSGVYGPFSERRVVTTTDGRYEVTVPFGDVLVAHSPGHLSQTRPAAIPFDMFESDNPTRLDFLLLPSTEVFEPSARSCMLSGTVQDEIAVEPLAAAQLSYLAPDDTVPRFVLSDRGGSFTMTDVSSGLGVLHVERVGFVAEYRDVLVRCDNASAGPHVPVLLREDPTLLPDVGPA